MINIQDTRIFYYGASQSVTVYGDYDDPKKWYIVPTPRYAVDKTSGQAMFTLQEFKTDKGTNGNCNFTVELYVSDQERLVAKQNLGQDIVFGQFDWLNITSYFTYELGGEKKLLNAIPSRFASNMVSFNIFLPDQAAVQTFINAFGPGSGSVSPFLLQYEGLALSKLPAVDVTVKYDSVLAFEYEKTVTVKKNIWGKETDRKAAVKEYLKNSDAGSTEITWNVQKPDEEMQQRVYDWAWVTLEGLVNQAIDEAIRRLGEANADKFTLNQTSSFVRTYSENQVVDFTITPMATMLPTFSSAEWSKHYIKTDNRTLTVSFTILDDLTVNNIQQVQLLVKYPSLSQDASHTFTPNDPSNWTLKAEGYSQGGVFDPTYQYRYIVTFTPETELTPYTSPWIPSVNTEVILPAATLGIQSATFRATNVDFANSVDFILLDFFFVTPGDLPNKSEQVKITQNNVDHKIVSRTGLPSENQYNYALTYVLKDKSRYLVTPISVFPPQNSDTIAITSPFRAKQFNIYVNLNKPKDGGPQISQVRLNGTYDDYENGLTGLNNRWNFAPDPAREYDEGEPWNLTVVENPNGSAVTLNGTIMLSNGSSRPVNGIKNQTGFIDFFPNAENITIEVDPSEVDWSTGVTQVRLNVYQLANAPTDAKEIAKAAANAETRTNLANLTFRPIRGADGKPIGTAVYKQYFTIFQPIGKETVYYYDGTYYHQSTPDSYINKTESRDLAIVLPKDGQSKTQTIHRVILPVKETK